MRIAVNRREQLSSTPAMGNRKILSGSNPSFDLDPGQIAITFRIHFEFRPRADCTPGFLLSCVFVAPSL
jgi:hypothetical protein